MSFLWFLTYHIAISDTFHRLDKAFPVALYISEFRFTNQNL